jgi:hypothetical protein
LRQRGVESIRFGFDDRAIVLTAVFPKSGVRGLFLVEVETNAYLFPVHFNVDMKPWVKMSAQAPNVGEFTTFWVSEWRIAGPP